MAIKMNLFKEYEGVLNDAFADIRTKAPTDDVYPITPYHGTFNKTMKKLPIASTLKLKKYRATNIGKLLQFSTFPTKGTIYNPMPDTLSCSLRFNQEFFRNMKCFSLVISRAEMHSIFNFLRLNRREFAAVPLEHEWIIRETKTIVIKVVIDKKSNSPVKCVDIRMYHKGEEGVHMFTRYGINLDGYDALYEFMQAEDQMISCMDEMAAYMSICTFLTADLGRRFLSFSHNLPDYVPADYYDGKNNKKVRITISKYLYDVVPLYLTTQHMQALSLRYKARHTFTLEQLNDVIYEDVLDYIVKHYVPKPAPTTQDPSLMSSSEFLSRMESPKLHIATIVEEEEDEAICMETEDSSTESNEESPSYSAYTPPLREKALTRSTSLP